MQKVAVFLNDSDSIDRVYAQHREAIASRCFLCPTVISRATMPEHRAMLQQAEIVFSTWGMPTLTEDEIAYFLPNLKQVFYAAGSVQAFARPFLRRGVGVMSAWAANAVPVAEYTVAQILLACKGFFHSMPLCKGDRAASQRAAAAFEGIYGVKVGIIGAGMIGKMVIAQLARHDIQVLICDPFLSAQQAQQLGGRKAELAEVFASCRVISNHVANLPATVGMMRYEHFSAMRSYAVFLNTGRGAQVVEADLARALREDPTRLAILDVTDPEPPEADSPLMGLSNALLTPHIAGSSGDEVRRMAAYAVEELDRYLAGQPLRYAVTLPMLSTMA